MVLQLGETLFSKSDSSVGEIRAQTTSRHFRNSYICSGGTIVLNRHAHLQPRQKDDMSKAYSFLFIPFGVQIVWFTAGAIYSTHSKHREIIFGILWGFALEFAALVALITISASAHY